MLSSYIVEQLERQQRSTLLFAFSSTGTCQRTAADMTRTLVWQLLHKSVDERSVDIVHELMSRGQLITSDLWEALGKILDLSLAPVFCVVDGIDECNDIDRTVIERLFKILHCNSMLRVVLLGRPPAIQGISLTSTFNVSVIEVTATVISQDINSYIEDEIAKSQLLSDSKSTNEISHILQEKSDGMFLWVKLTIEDLRKAATRSEIVERIQKSPRGLEDIYRAILSRLTQKLDRFELQLAQNILGFATVCCRPLTYDQLRYAHALDLRSRCYSSTPRVLDEFLIVHPIQRIVELCGGLIFEADGVVRLIHSSVKDFLARPPDQWSKSADSNLSSFFVAESKFHGLFSHLCLDYLNMAWDINLLSEPSELHTIHTRYPFLKYAALHGVYHLNRVGSPSPSLLGKLQTLFEAFQSDFWVVYWASLILDDTSLEMLALMMDEYMSFDVWIGCHIKLDLTIAFFKDVGQELITRTRNLGPSHHLSAQWQTLFDFAKDFADSDAHIYIEDEHVIHSNERKFEDTTSLEPSLPHFSNSRVKFDPSRIGALVNSRFGKSLSCRIELTLGLNILLKRSMKLSDPLEKLLQLLLTKAEDLPLVVLNSIALFYLRLSKFETAIQFFEAALSKIRGQNIAKEFGLHNDISYCYRMLLNNEKALHHCDLAHAGMESLFGKQHVKAIESLATKCEYLCLLERYEESRECCSSLIVRSQAVYGDNHEETLMARYWEGRSLYELKRCDEALVCFQAASATKNPTRKLNVKYFNSIVLYRLKRYEEALPFFQEVLANDTANLGEGDKNTLSSLYWTGKSHYRLSQYNDALAAFQKLSAANKIASGVNDKITLGSMFWVGLTLYQLGRYEESLASFREIVIADKMVYGENHQATLESISKVLECLYHLHRYDDALLLAGKYGTLVSSIPGDCLFKLHRYDEAFLWFQNYQNIQKERFGEGHEGTAITLHWVGVCLAETYRYEEALLWFQKTLDAARLRHGNLYEGIIIDVYWAGLCFYNLNRYEEALECMDIRLVRPGRVNLCLMAECHLELSQYSRALECLEKICIDGDKHNLNELLLMAECHEELSQYEKATTCYILAYNIEELDVLD